MPTVDVWNLEHEKVGSLELTDDVFGQIQRSDLVWETVRSQLAKQRRGTASTKTRATVSGTGAKPFRQKRTGRARQGTRRSPHHEGGGVAFGPKPRSFGYSVPKKVRRQALRSALSDQVRDQKLFVVKDFEMPEIKTKHLSTILGRFGIHKGLLVDRKDNVSLKLSARNLPTFHFRSLDGLNLVDLLRYDCMMISEASVKQLEGELKP